MNFKTISLMAIAAVSLPLFAESLTFTGSTVKNPLLYKVGEEMTFSLTLVDRDAKNVPVPGRRLKWTRVGDDGKTERGEGVSDGPLVVKTKIDRPGFVRLTVNVLDANGKALMGRTEQFDGGAGAGVNEIVTTPIPSDFNAFWDGELARMASVPMQGVLTPIASKDPDVAMNTFSVNTVPGEGPATGVVAWPKNASPKSLKMIVNVTGYGFGATGVSMNEVKSDGGRLVVSITRHGESPCEDKAYYKNLETNVLKGYCWRNTRSKTANDEFKMIMRDVRGLAFMKTLPQWNGKDIKVTGGSMGGFQSIALAALDKSVTECSAFIPWMIDLAGRTNCKRMGGWLPDWTPELAYIDTINLATRVTCPVSMGIGLGDYVCPPSGQMLLFRNLKGPKTMSVTQNMGHGSQYGVQSAVYAFKDAIR